MPFNLDFANSTILSCFFFFFFITDSHFLIHAVTEQIFIPTAELVMPTGIATNEANAEIKTQPVTVDAKISKSVQHNLSNYMSSYIFNSLNHYILFLLNDNFLFHLGFFLI